MLKSVCSISCYISTKIFVVSCANIRSTPSCEEHNSHLRLLWDSGLMPGKVFMYLIHLCIYVFISKIHIELFQQIK